MPIANSRIPLTAENKATLRRAIIASGRWNRAYRDAHNLSFAEMSKEQYYDVCDDFSINVRAALNNGNSNGTWDDASTAQDTREGTDMDDDMSREDREVLRARAIDAAMRDGAVQAAAEFKTDAQRSWETREQVQRDRWQYADTRQPNRAAQARADFDMCPNDKTAKATSAPTSVPGNEDAAAQLMAAIAALTSKGNMSADEVRALARAECEAWIAANPMLSTRIELTYQGETVRTIDGHQHPEFARMLRAATARDVNGYPLNVWIAGPAGSGKTHAVTQVAKALGIAMHLNGAIGMAHELLGFVDAGGRYHETPFRRAYENGGCYLFDEVDGSDNSALLALNAALANNNASFPDTAIGRHSDCHIFAAANTWGHGATAEYVGRSKIDAAFLSRFPVKIDWQYDDELERNICGNASFARRVQKARKAAASCHLKVLITPRDSIAGAALIAAGFSEKEAADMTYLASVEPAQRAMIEAA